ncbi:MAG TPA: methyl-accepting chemotaxis protein [Crinalium sp.]
MTAKFSKPTAAASDDGSNDNRSDYFLDQITSASALEQAGQIQNAIDVYQRVLEADPQGQFGAIARKALQGLNATPISEPETLADALDEIAQVAYQPLSLNSLDASGSLEYHDDDLLAQITKASALQQSGQTAEAIERYKRILENDAQGSYGAIARKALESLGALPSVAVPAAGTMYRPRPTVLPKAPVPTVSSTKRFPPLRWFYNLPIRNKQIIGLFTSEFVSLVGLVGVSTVLIVNGLYSGLGRQAKSELGVMGITYNIKIDQMGFGFRGQSDNTAIIAAAQSGVASPQVFAILQNEIKAREIEYATLVDRNLRIIANANANRRGAVFNPNNLASRVLQNPEQIKTTEVVPWEELQRELPPLPDGFNGQDALIRYTATPVRDPNSQSVIGVLISGDIVNQKLPIVQRTIGALQDSGGGYSAVYLRKPTGEFALATSLEMQGNKPLANVALPNLQILTEAVKANGEAVIGQETINGKSYTIAARALPSSSGQPTAILVRGTPQSEVLQLLNHSLLVQFFVFIAVLAIDVIIASVLAQAIAVPIKRLRTSAEKIAEGDRDARADVFAEDEVGQLAITFNQMADNVAARSQEVEELAELRQSEANFQRQEKERLQERVMELLLEIDGARQGNLTVRANVTADEMGSIADAFNATINSLQELVLQVKDVSSQVNQNAAESDTSMNQLSDAALKQAEAITHALQSVEQMAQSIRSVASSASEAAQIAREASQAASTGGKAMERTVESIEDIRNTAAETSKKVKRLTESSQEISKIVALISEVSAKTNLLAFNASIEAVRAGEHGQGFRIVADEVRRLAERVNESTKEIEQLVTGIQTETAEVLEMMERGTTQVVTGSRLITETRETLSELVQVSQKIDHLVQSISDSTTSQTQASQQVSQVIQEVAQVAHNTSIESKTVSETLKRLVDVSDELQKSVAKFSVGRV